VPLLLTVPLHEADFSSPLHLTTHV